MNVLLLTHTPEPDKVVAYAANLCYSDATISDTAERFIDTAEQRRLIGILLKQNHLSPFEHATFTFGIEGVSRALSHQLVRHRIASYSQQSQRYVADRPDLPCVKPASIARSVFSDKYDDYIEEGKKLYAEMSAAGIPKEDARYLLVNATMTSVISTMNARALLNFFELRCCKHAQWEIRTMAFLMLARVKKVAPLLFEKAGPTCFRGFCRERDGKCALRARYCSDANR